MDKEKVLDQMLEIVLKDKDVSFNNYDEKYDEWKKQCIMFDVTHDDVKLMELEDRFLRLDLLNRPLIDCENLNCVNESLNSSISFSDKIALLKCDITSLYVDAICNDAECDLNGSTKVIDCIDNNIHFRAGLRLKLKCNDIMKGNLLNPSEILITRSYNMPCDFIIHSAKCGQDEELIRQSYENILECAKNNLIKSIALVPISYEDGISIVDSYRIALEVIEDYLTVNDKFFSKIIFTCNNNDELKELESLFK